MQKVRSRGKGLEQEALEKRKARVKNEDVEGSKDPRGQIAHLPLAFS